MSNNFIEYPDTWENVYRQLRNKEITIKTASRLLNRPVGTVFNLCKQQFIKDRGADPERSK